MFKTKGSGLGVAAALVVAGVLVAGLAMSTASGAGTDPNPGNIGSGDINFDTGSDPGTNPGNPPAAPIEQPGTQPGTGAPTGTGANPNGGQLGVDGAPGSLPNAGFGTADGGSSNSTLVALMAIAGAGLAAAGATAFRAGKRG